MATPPNDDTRLLFKLLSDGGWHQYEEIRDRVAAAVPPGRALRRYQERVEYTRRSKEDPGYDTQMSEDERIFYGQRAIGQSIITSWKGKGIQYRGEGTLKEIRIKPGFKSWGLINPLAEEKRPETARGETEVPPDDSEPSEPGQQAPAEAEPVTAVPEADEAPRTPEPLAQQSTAATEEEPYYDWTPSRSVSRATSSFTCAVCGSWVTDEELHDQFHEAYEKKGSRSDMALFAESELRSLLGDVVRQELDQFQSGMQTWLGMQFTQLEQQVFLALGGPWRTPPNRKRF